MKAPVSLLAVMVFVTLLSLMLRNEPALAADGCPAPGFATPRTFNAGPSPRSVAMGDFNGDGKSDLAAVNRTGVSVLLGHGDGTFLPPVTNRVGATLVSIATGDFNGDGKADLALADGGTFRYSGLPPTYNEDGGVLVVLGNGDGTFRTPVNYGTVANPGSVAVGDFNGDGKLDLVVANVGLAQNSYSDGNVSVLLNKGDGTFHPAVRYTAGLYPRSAVVGDFNGDGKADIVAANSASRNVSVLLGHGDGTFQAAVHYETGLGAYAVAVADFNGDGKPDLGVANFGAGGMDGPPGNISVLLGKGDGTFQPAVNYSAGIHPYSVASGDFNGDGQPDLVVGLNASGIVSVLLNKGDGSFKTALSYSVGRENLFVAAGDLDRDGRPDLAVVDGYNISIVLADADGTFRAPVNETVGGNVYSVAAGDFDGDGKLDLTVAYAGAYDPNFGTYTNTGVFVLLGNGQGHFPTTINYGGGNPSSVAAGDFNGDGKLDLATASTVSSNVSIRLGNGDGTFQSAVNYTAAGSFVAVADLNGDGKLDLATTISVLLGNGDGTLREAVNYGSGGSSVAVGDFDGDGKPDLAVARGLAGTVSMFLGNGDGTFKTPVSFSAGAGLQSVTAGDFNGDGKLDLAVADDAPDDWGFYLQLLVFLGRGDGRFESPLTYPGVGGYSVVTGDFNGDGKLDLAFPATVLLGNGDGSFQPAASLGVGGYSVVAGDFNGDGKPDLAVIRNAFSSISYVSVLLNSCASAGVHLDIVRRNNTSVTLSWPLPATNYGLESKTNLDAANWQVVSERVTTSHGRSEVTVPLGQGPCYFRLRTP